MARGTGDAAGRTLHLLPALCSTQVSAHPNRPQPLTAAASSGPLHSRAETEASRLYHSAVPPPIPREVAHWFVSSHRISPHLFSLLLLILPNTAASHRRCKVACGDQTSCHLEWCRVMLYLSRQASSWAQGTCSPRSSQFSSWCPAAGAQSSAVLSREARAARNPAREGSHPTALHSSQTWPHTGAQWCHCPGRARRSQHLHMGEQEEPTHLTHLSARLQNPPWPCTSLRSV